MHRPLLQLDALPKGLRELLPRRLLQTPSVLQLQLHIPLVRLVGLFAHLQIF